MARLPPLRVLSLLLTLAACGGASTTFDPPPDGGDDATPAGDVAVDDDASAPRDASAGGDASADASSGGDAGSGGDASAPRDASDAAADVTVDVGACMARSLGSRVGDAVAEGDTGDGADDGAGTCGGEGAPESYFVWTAPSAGTYTFDTNGTDFDTVLYLRDGACTGAEIDCNDDNDDGVQSTVTATLRAGQTIVIVVDGYDEKELGPFVLNISSGGSATDGGTFDAGEFDGGGPDI